MKITVLGGSPKGMNSITLKYVQYLEKRNPQHEFSYHPVAGRISVLEEKPEELEGVLREAAASDLVVWAFPLYYLLCCSQYKRFIELVFERHPDALREVPAAAVVTSIKFYDSTALNYIREIFQELGMPFCGEFSAYGSDLFREKERERLESFFRTVEGRIAEKRFLSSETIPTSRETIQYTPGTGQPLKVQGKWMVVTDMKEAGENLKNMVRKLVETAGGTPEVVDLGDIDFKPCSGCCRCGPDNECMYGEDAYVMFHRYGLRKADVLIFAGEVKDRYLSSKWKKFFDRSFYMGHTPSLKGKQIGFLITGDLASNHNLQEILRSWCEFQKLSPGGFIGDQADSSEEVDVMIEDLVWNLENGRRSGYMPPETYRHVGGMKIFRDFVWGPMRPLFQADHRYYRKNGIYDFPQKDLRTRLKNMFLPWLLRIPPIKKRVLRDLPKMMTQSFDRIIQGG